MNTDLSELPAFLLMTAEQRRAAWATWDAKNPHLVPKGIKTMGSKADQVRALREANATGTRPKPNPATKAALKASVAQKPAAPEADGTDKTAPASAAADTKGPQTAAETKESKTMRTKTKQTTKAKAKSKANGSARGSSTSKKAARSPARGKGAEGGVRPGSKLEMVVKLLQRPGGCTSADVLKATGWPSVSMPQQAAAAGLTLKKEKKDGVTIYSA